MSGLPPESIVDCSLPFIANENEGIHQGGTNDYYPTFVDIGNLSLTFIENQKGTVIRSLDLWKRLTQRPDELFNYSVDYKRFVECELLDNMNEVHTKVRLIGVWPSTTSPENLDYTNSDVWRISQEFSVDGAEIQGSRGGSVSRGQTSGSRRPGPVFLDTRDNTGLIRPLVDPLSRAALDNRIIEGI